MSGNGNYGNYIDEYWTKGTSVKITEEDKRVTETINNSKSAAELQKQTIELQRQNDLYEKEIKELRRTGTITMVAAIIAAIASIASAVLPIILRCPS